MSLATTRRGDILLEFRPGAEVQIPEAERHIPMTFALVAAWHEGKILFMFNHWRQEWELPGGKIDPGEDTATCAGRELTEETRQVAPSLRCVGLMKCQLEPDNRLEFGMLYACELQSIVPFVPNNEAERIIWWDLHSPVEGYVSPIDRKLAELSLTD